MSGPNYPSTNAVGPEGVIPFDVWDTIISQYANSDILTQLITNINDYIDQTKNIDAFYQYIWNVDTAEGLGLDIWGRIVGVNRVVYIASDDKYLGFKDALPSSVPFGSGTFYPDNASSQAYPLADIDYRKLIFAKALYNITDGSTKAINQILLNLFPGRGNCYVAETGLMQIEYTFEFPLNPIDFAIVNSSGVLPKPTGVRATGVVAGTATDFFDVTVDGANYDSFYVEKDDGTYDIYKIQTQENPDLTYLTANFDYFTPLYSGANQFLSVKLTDGSYQSLKVPLL